MARTGAVLASLLSVAVAGTLLAGCAGEGDPARRPWKDTPPTVAAIPAPSGGNGVGALSPADALAKAIAATAAATSVRVTGSVSAAYQTSLRRAAGVRGDQDFAIDMLFTNTGSTGDITEAGATLRVLRVQRNVWLGGQDVWTRLTSERVAPSYQGKYVPLAVGDSSLGPLVDATYLVPLLNKLLSVNQATLVAGGMAMVHGIPALGLVSSGHGAGGTVWVATRGQPHVLRVETAKDSPLSGALDFTDYDQRVPLSPPAPSQVVDPNDLSVPLRRALGTLPGGARSGPGGANPGPSGAASPGPGGAGGPASPAGPTPSAPTTAASTPPAGRRAATAPSGPAAVSASPVR